MWVFTTEGFYSAVQHRAEPDTLVVRCRVELDALRLRDWLRKHGHPDMEVEHTPTADYEWRLFVPRLAFGHYVLIATQDIDYPNFKHAVGERQGRQRARVYSNVWADVYALQSGPKVPG